MIRPAQHAGLGVGCLEPSAVQSPAVALLARVGAANWRVSDFGEAGPAFRQDWDLRLTGGLAQRSGRKRKEKSLTHPITQAKRTLYEKVFPSFRALHFGGIIDQLRYP
jgi:hypothetical protein